MRVLVHALSSWNTSSSSICCPQLDPRSCSVNASCVIPRRGSKSLLTGLSTYTKMFSLSRVPGKRVKTPSHSSARLTGPVMRMDIGSLNDGHAMSMSADTHAIDATTSSSILCGSTSFLSPKLRPRQLTRRLETWTQHGKGSGYVTN